MSSVWGCLVNMLYFVGVWKICNISFCLLPSFMHSAFRLDWLATSIQCRKFSSDNPFTTLQVLQNSQLNCKKISIFWIVVPFIHFMGFKPQTLFFSKISKFWIIFYHTIKARLLSVDFGILRKFLVAWYWMGILLCLNIKWIFLVAPQFFTIST